MATVLAGMLVTQTGCIGNSNLTRSLLSWNEQVSNKWVNELIFVGLNMVPVYWFSLMGDAFVFNSIEFWTGKNPVTRTRGGVDDVALQSFQSGDRRLEVERVRVETGQELRLRGYEQGELVHEGRLLAPGGGLIHTLGPDREVLATAALRPDGSASIHDAATGETTEFGSGTR